MLDKAFAERIIHDYKVPVLAEGGCAVALSPLIYMCLSLTLTYARIVFTYEDYEAKKKKV